MSISYSPHLRVEVKEDRILTAVSTQSVPLSNFKLFPFASCGQFNKFEECQSTIAMRKTLRKILPDGTSSYYSAYSQLTLLQEPPTTAASLATSHRIWYVSISCMRMNCLTVWLSRQAFESSSLRRVALRSIGMSCPGWLSMTVDTLCASYTFPEGTEFPRILVDLSNDGQRSATDPIMDVDPDTGRAKGAHLSFDQPPCISASY